MPSSIAHLAADVRDALATDMTIDITTTGRRSGQPRRIEIWFLNIDGLIYITGSPGPRDWFANVRADPRLTFHLKQSVTVDLAAVATEVINSEERQRVFEAASAAWYLSQGDSLQSLLDEAPMVRLAFATEPS